MRRKEREILCRESSLTHNSKYNGRKKARMEEKRENSQRTAFSPAPPPKNKTEDEYNSQEGEKVDNRR